MELKAKLYYWSNLTLRGHHCVQGFCLRYMVNPVRIFRQIGIGSIQLLSNVFY